MATFPTFESSLIEIANALGANKGLTTKKKNKFKSGEMSLDSIFTTWIDTLNSISDVFGLDEEAKKDLISNIRHDYQAHKAIELNIFSYKASKRKIVWHYLSRLLIPTIARHAAFWQIDSRIDSGMPGGKFWYLPNIQSTTNIEIEQPVQHVLKWLVDLIEEPKAKFTKNIENDLRIYESSGSLLKNLYNWQNAKNTPEISSINNTFPDEVKIRFKGCFLPDSKKLEFEQALDFVNKKGLSPESLQYELSLSIEGLTSILKGDCSNDAKQKFVLQLKDRYQKPSSKTIRQRLIVARAIQEGYGRLVKFLTPSVDKRCTNFEENKTLQLIELFKLVYNITIDARKQCAHLGVEAENVYFTESLPPYLRYDILLSFNFKEPPPPIPVVPLRLNEVFSEVGEEEKIESIFPMSKEEVNTKQNELTDYLSKKIAFEREADKLINLLKENKTPFKAINKIDSFDLLYETANSIYSSPKIKPLILQRMAEIEVTPEHEIKRLIFELTELLIVQKFNKNTEEYVTTFLEKAKNNVEFCFWRPLFLRFEAYHQIGKNQLKEAEKLFNQAIDECKNFNFGSLRGELAHDAFAIAISNQKLIPNNHEKYFREMILWGGLKNINPSNASFPSIYDISRELHEHFWRYLYKCYPNYIPLFSDSENDFKLFIQDITPHIKAGTSIQQALKKHKNLKNKQLKYPQSDSIILILMKLCYVTLTELKTNKHAFNIPDKVRVEIKSVYKKSIDVIRSIIQEWPEIVNLSDFKQQTPLMLAANEKDYKTVEVLLNTKANPNLKDITGRTALNSACASRCLKSVNLLIENGIDGTLTTIEGATALHTAVRIGEIKIAKKILQHFPELAFVEDFNDKTPSQLAEYIANDKYYYHALQKHLKSENRTTVSHETYKNLLKLF